MLLTSTYTSETKRAIQIAQSIAKEYQHTNFGPPHLLQGVLHNDVGLASLLVTWEVDIHYLRDWADIRIANYPKGSPVPEITGDQKVLGVLEVADVARLKLTEDQISPLALLLAMCKPNVGFSAEQLKTFPLTEKSIIEATLGSISSLSQEGSKTKATSKTSSSKSKQSSQNALAKFCRDKTEDATAGKIDPIIGRDAEIRMMTEVLGRRTKPNVIIVGEPGVGKTALVDGFALNIVAGKVPENLANVPIFELDMGSLIAGASYKGEIEDRLKNIMAEIKAYPKAILFIDEIHILLDPAGGAGGAANLLKPELARGELTVIGATTNDEYREFIENDDAFRRRFEVVRVQEPDVITTARMLQTLVPLYEEHHEIKVAPAAIPETVFLAKRYIKDRRLPDAAIDLMDRTMASIRMMVQTSEKDLKEAADLFKELDPAKTELNEKDLRTELLWFYSQMKSGLSPILLGQLTDEREPKEMETAGEIHSFLVDTFAALNKIPITEKETVEKADVAAVVAYKTGIPLGKIQAKEKEKLLNLEDYLRNRVVGQDHALKILSEAVRISRSGLDKPGLPIGSFFFTGSTGTGKTELAKSLAEFLFNDEKALIRFDMSEFKEEHSAALLYGAPPGYIGYKEGGLLVNKIREQPYAIVLFDEIEKAHKSVFDIFLQILDEGKLSDKLGKVGDFSNAIILFTSNIGSKEVVSSFNKGEIPDSKKLRKIMGEHFRPEFLGRLTEIVPFAPIAEKVIELIFNIQMKGLLKVLKQQGIGLELTEKAAKKLAKDGFDPELGARPIRGVIRNELQRPISRMIISEKVKKGNMIKVDLTKENQLDWKII